MSLDPEVKIKELEASLAERDAMFARLREAYTDLESAAPLIELGQASSFINHEIKNYMMVISGYAALLLRSKTLSDKERGMAGNIAQTAAKLQEFSSSVQESARTAVHGGEEFDLSDILRKRIDADFADKAACVSIRSDAAGTAALVNGDPQKLSKAFACALENAADAGARNIGVNIYVRNYTALVTIDDDGAGCGADTFPSLSKTFFTTKRGQDGAGLGLCVLRSVVSAHGGNVSIYSKNLLGGNSRGMSVQITIPASKRTQCPALACETALVRDGFDDIAGILKVMKNLKIVPRMANEAKDAVTARGGASLAAVILAAPKQAAELRRTAAGDPSVKILTIEKCGVGQLFVTDADGIKELFTEEYIARQTTQTT